MRPRRTPYVHFEGIGACFYARMGMRAPKRGDFYLSGTNENHQPDAYRAPNDLMTAYEIVIPTHRAVLVTRMVRGELVDVPPLRPGRGVVSS